MPDPATLAAKLQSEAARRGLSWFGVVHADHLAEDESRLRDWIAAGHHADMVWMAREPERRSDPARVVPNCRSVIVVGLNYLRNFLPELPATGPSSPSRPSSPFGLISKYARTRDYHRVLERELRALGRVLAEHAPGANWRAMVDAGPALERAWASRAGLGFIGKNTMLIHPREGSFHFLGVLFTDAELAPTPPPPEMTGCGACRRCIDACPTQAIVADRQVDARRCLSYLTIEIRQSPEEEFWPHFEGNVFGCDICQDVCPYNRTRAPIAPADSPLGPEIVPAQWRLADMIRITQQELDAYPVATPLRRTGRDGLSRNACVVASERGEAEELAALRELAADETRVGWLRELARRCGNRMVARTTG